MTIMFVTIVRIVCRVLYEVNRKFNETKNTCLDTYGKFSRIVVQIITSKIRRPYCCGTGPHAGPVSEVGLSVFGFFRKK